MDRTKDTDRFNEIAKKFGEKDVRFAQAISNLLFRMSQDEDGDIFNLENDQFADLLEKELKRYT